MQRILIPVLAVAVALAGCIGQETERTGTDDGGTGGGAGGSGNMSAGAGANVTAGNTTGNATGNATIGTVGNATAGNETGNMTGNETQPPPRELANETHSFAGAPPAEATFVVDQPYRRLVVNVSAEGLIADLRVVVTDGGGNETVVFDGTVAGEMSPKTTAILRPSLGTWMVNFEGTGAGSVMVSVRGE